MAIYTENTDVYGYLFREGSKAPEFTTYSTMLQSDPSAALVPFRMHSWRFESAIGALRSGIAGGIMVQPALATEAFGYAEAYTDLAMRTKLVDTLLVDRDTRQVTGDCAGVVAIRALHGNAISEMKQGNSIPEIKEPRVLIMGDQEFTRMALVAIAGQVDYAMILSDNDWGRQIAEDPMITFGIKVDVCTSEELPDRIHETNYPIRQDMLRTPPGLNAAYLLASTVGLFRGIPDALVGKTAEAYMDILNLEEARKKVDGI